MKKIFIFLFFIFLILPIVTKAQANETLESYLEPFYNRYSANFEENGLVYAVPGYGIENFKEVETPREIMSLTAYFRFRAQAEEVEPKNIIKVAVETADSILAEKTPRQFSFEDSTAQFLMWQMLEAVPLDFSSIENKIYKQKILARAEKNLLAPDTENRAILSAVYWQVILNKALEEGTISKEQKIKIDKIIKDKIDIAAEDCIDSDGWYVEGSPKKFNPHYHLVTAFSLMVYGSMMEDVYYANLAKKMTENLRAISFANGMVEARIGDRPVGLGAQFYLGAGLLNWYYGFKDYGTYLKFAQGDKFFSDPNYPNRLEYHATRANEAANFHDDYAFSNLAELASSLPFFAGQSINYRQSLTNGNTKEINYNGKKIVLQTNDTTKIVDKSVAKKIVKAFKIENKNEENFDEIEAGLILINRVESILAALIGK